MVASEPQFGRRCTGSSLLAPVSLAANVCHHYHCRFRIGCLSWDFCKCSSLLLSVKWAQHVFCHTRASASGECSTVSRRSIPPIFLESLSLFPSIGSLLHCCKSMLTRFAENFTTAGCRRTTLIENCNLQLKASSNSLKDLRYRLRTKEKQ